MNKNPYKTILLSGAGFSTPLGPQTLETLPRLLAPLTSSDSVVNLVRESYATVSGHIGHDASLEELLSYLKKCYEAASLIEHDPIFGRQISINHTHQGQISELWAGATSYCYRMMLDNYGPQAIDTSPTCSFNSISDSLKVVTAANNGILHIFSTNYDCLPQVLATKHKEIKFYCRINNINGQFDKSWFPMNPENQQYSIYKIYFHRLHGCVGWFLDDRSPYRVTEVYGAGSRLVIRDRNKLLKMAIKLVSEETLGKIPAFSLAFEDFKTALHRCKCLIIWGYSFRDKEVLRVIIETHHQRTSRTFSVYFVDPYLEEQKAVEHMRSTLADIPGLQIGSFKPIHIDWVEQDGYPRLQQLLKEIAERQ